MQRFELKTVDGLRGLIVPHFGWDDGLLKVIDRKSIEYLSLTGVESDVEFVRHLGHLKRLVLHVATPRDLRPLEALTSVTELWLQLGPGRTPPVALNALPNLVDLGTDWVPGLEAIGLCTRLERLLLGRPPLSDIEWLSGLTNLKKLTLCDGNKLKRLDGIEHFQQLDSLTVTSLRKLESLEGIERLRHLRKIDITSCRQIDSIEPVRGLPELVDLWLEDCGTIDSITPLDEVDHLESFFATGDLKIADGDLSPLLRRPRLRRVGVVSRRGYRPPVTEIEARFPA